MYVYVCMYVCMRALYRGDGEHFVASDGNLAIVSQTFQHGVLRALRTCATRRGNCHTNTYIHTYIYCGVVTYIHIHTTS